MTAIELLRQPPFRMAADAGPAAAAAAIVAAFSRLAAAPAPLVTAWTLAMQVSGVDAAEPLHRAGMAAARDIDAGIGAGCGNGYHNSRHFCEVLLCTLAIAQLAGLDRQEQPLVLLAALLHDFHHDGRPRLQPFRHELCSVAASLPYLEAAGVGAAERAVLATLILATDSVHGVPLARCCHGWHSGMATPPPAPPRPELASLASLPRLALMAVVLAEADVLPSVALTPAHAALTTARLEAEWNTVLGTRGKVDFIDRHIGALQAARFFEPNLRAVRQASLER
ncbi:MAG: hypothetical protein ABWY05_04235 [Noviherbaspirillum sp.]